MKFKVRVTQQPPDYWYHHRHELKPGMVFRDYEGDLVKLDRRVPGDGTRWYVAVLGYGHWIWDNTEIEPGDLRGLPLGDPVS